MMDASEVEAQIENFVRQQFNVHGNDPRFDRAANLFEQGYVDSVGVVELLAFLQEAFGVEIPESDLTSDAFTTIEGIADLLVRLRDTSAA
jgi:methoxymalonate biosynthesis acyl carrier protein